MKKILPVWKLFALLTVCVSLRIEAQEFAVFAGSMATANLKESSYTWQLDYAQDLNQYVLASIAYINEGHVVGHHRDGSAFELWGRLPFWKDRLSLAVGVGPYYFYDTQSLPNGDSANIHGTAPIFSLSATGYLGHRLFYQLRLNRINPATDVKVNTAALGVGYWFGRSEKPTRGKSGPDLEEHHFVTESQLTFFGGQSVVNTLFSESARAGAVEFRRGILPHIDLTAGIIYEGDPEIVRRSGLVTQGWLVSTFLNERFTVGVGLGPYFFLDRKHPRTDNRNNPAAIAPLASITLSARLTEHFLVRIIWDRVTSTYNRDADIFLVGLGYRWPR